MPSNAGRRVAILAALACCGGSFAVGYGAGVVSYARNYWPVSLMLQARQASPGTFDAQGRLASYPGKVPVPCGEAGAGVAVLLVLGQSNAANHGAELYQPHHAGDVLNYHAGVCFPAASPLLGATGDQGEFVTMLADRLIDAGIYQRVIIADAAVTMAPAARWEDGGDLMTSTATTLDQLAVGLPVTHVLWMQGERDFEDRTTAAQYRAAFWSMLGALDRHGIRAPVFVGITSKCLDLARWTPGNPVAQAQRALIDGRRVFLGADTDALLDDADRRGDHCHLASSGQHKVAEAFADAIERHQRDQ